MCGLHHLLLEVQQETERRYAATSISDLVQSPREAGPLCSPELLTEHQMVV